MPKLSFKKNRRGTNLTHMSEGKGVYTFPKDICPKVNVIAQLGFELTYYDSAVQCFNHYTTRTSLRPG